MIVADTDVVIFAQPLKKVNFAILPSASCFCRVPGRLRAESQAV